MLKYINRAKISTLLSDMSGGSTANQKRKKWWGGPSRLITSRFATEKPVGPQDLAKPSKSKSEPAAAPLVEALEPRLLLNADISPWLPTLTDGLEEVSEFFEDLEKSDAMNLALPLFGESMDDFVDLSDLIQDTITEFNDILADIDEFSDADTQALMTELETRLGAASSSYDVDNGITFTFEYDADEQINLGFNIEGTALDIDATSNAAASFTIGVDFTTVDPSDAFYVTFGDIELGLSASDPDIDASVEVGGVTASIADGTFDLNLVLGLDLVSPSGDEIWTLDEMDAVGTDADLPGVSFTTDVGTFTANMPLTFTAGSFEATELVEAALVADVSNVFDLQDSDVFELQATISGDLQLDIVAALDLADDALAAALPQLNELLDQDVPGLGQSFTDLLGSSPDFSTALDSVDLSELADDYFTATDVESTFEGLMTALADGLSAAGSDLVPTLDSDTLTLSFDLAISEDVSLGATTLDAASLGLDGLTGTAGISTGGPLTLVGGIGFDLDLDAQDGIGLSVSSASLGLEGALDISASDLSYTFAGFSVAVSGSGAVTFNGRVSAEDSNANGEIDADEILAVSPEASLDVHFDLTADADVPMGDLGDIADVAVIVDGTLDIADGDINSDLSIDVDFTISPDLQTTILNLMDDVDQYLTLANDQIANGLGQTLPVINQTLAAILGLNDGETLLPDVDFNQVASDYFDLAGAASTMDGLLTALSDELADVESALAVNFDPETLGLDIGLSLENVVILENQLIASSSLALGDFGGAIAASGIFDLRGHIDINLGLTMALMGDSGPAMSVTEVSMDVDLAASVDDFEAIGDIAGIGGGVSGGSASLEITGSISATDSNDDGVIDFDEIGQLSRDVSLSVDAVLPLVTEGVDLLGEDGLVAPVVTVHSDNILAGVSDDNITYFVDFIIGSDLDVAISKVFDGIDAVLDAALDGIAAVLDQDMPGIGQTIGEVLGLTAAEVRAISDDLDLAQLYADLKEEKATLSGDLPEGETAEVTLRELLAAVNTEIMTALATATGAQAPVAVDGNEVSFLDGMFSVELDTENETLVFNVNIDEALTTALVTLDGSAFNDDLGVDIDTEITPTLVLTMSATMPLSDPLAVTVDNWSASLQLNVDVLGEADGETAEITVGPFGVTVVDGELDLAFSVEGEALSPNEGEVSFDPVSPPAELVMSGELAVGGLLSGEFAEDSHVGTYGTLSISAAGEWSYELTASNISSTVVDSFALTNVDGENVTVPVTITASNGLVFPLTNVSELEVSDTASLAIYVGTYGTLQVYAGTGGTRDISYQLNTSAINAAVDDPAVPADVTDSFNILQDDGSIEELVVELTLPSKSSVDFDVPEGHGFEPQTGAAEAYGSFTITADGAWSYTVDMANGDVAALTAGDSLTDEVTVTRVDGTSEIISVTINGPDEVADPEEPAEEDPAGQQLTFEASFDGSIELDATFDGFGTAATLLFDVHSDNLFGDTGVVSGDVGDLDTYADLALDLTSIEYGYDMIIGSDLVDWVMDQLIELDTILTDAMDDVDDVLDIIVPGLDKPLGEVLGMELDGDGFYSLDVPFSLTAIFQDYLDLADESDDIAFPTVGGLFDYLKDEVSKSLGFISIYFDPDDFAFDVDVSLPFFASLETDWDLDLATFAGDDIDIFEVGNATASGHILADGFLLLDLGFGIDFVTTGDEPNVYFSDIGASGELNIDVDALNAAVEIGPFDAGIDGGTISVTVEFDSEIVADDTDGDGVMSLDELSAGAALEFNLDAEFDAVLPVNIGVGGFSSNDIGTPIFSLGGDLNLTHDGGDGSIPDGEFELAYSMSYSLDIEIKQTLEDVILDVVGAFGTLITDATDAVDELLMEIVPGTGMTLGDILGIDVSEIALDLHAITTDYFDAATVDDPATMLGMLEEISVEIGKQILPDLIGAVEDFINDGATMVFDELKDSLTPYIGNGEHVDDALSELEEFLASDPADITLDDILVLLRPVFANVISLIPGVDDDNQMRVDLSFNFDFGASQTFNLTPTSLNDIIEGVGFPLEFTSDEDGTLSADVTFDFNLGLGLDLSDISAGIEAYLYLPDAVDPLASLDSTAGIYGLNFGVNVDGLEAGVVGGSAEITLGLALEIDSDVDGRIDVDAANVTLVQSGDFLMELPFQVGTDDGGGMTFELMAATVSDADLVDGLNLTFEYSTFEMPTIIDIITQIDDRNMMFTGVDMVLAGLEDLLQTQFLDRLADVPMLGDALAEDGNFVGMIREQFDTVSDALGNNTGIAFGDFIAASLNQVFADLEIFNSDGSPIIWVNLLYHHDNGDGTFSDHILSMGGNDIYMFDGVIKNNINGGSLDGSGSDVDFAAILADDTLNDFHAMEIRLDFHADLIEEFNLEALDEIPLSFNLGLDFLQLNTDAVLDLELGLDINLALGISNEEGIYIGYDVVENELGLTLTAYLEGADGGMASMTLELGFLSFSAIDNGVDGHGSGITGSFGVDLIDPNENDMITWDELTGDVSLLAVSADLVAEGDIHLMTDMPAGIPQISVDFIFDQAISWELGVGMDVAPAHLQFNNLELDLGSFFSDILLPILSSVQDGLEPIEPVIDILTTPVPVLSDLAGQDLTMIDLAEIAIQASGKGKVDLSMLESILQIAQLIIDIPTDSDTLIIDFGDFDMGGVSEGSDNSSSISGATTGNSSSGSLGDSDGSSSSQGKKDKASGFMDSLGGVDGLDIPLLTDPSTLLGLLMGETVDLITYEIPGLEFYFEYRKDFLIVPQFMIWGGFFGEVELTADFTFGFDSYGIQSFIDGGSPLEIANGLYVSDNWAVAGDPNSDQPEVTLDVGIGVRGFGGLPGLVELGVYGGLFGHIELDLHDPGFTAEGEVGVPDGKIRIDEVINQLALGPLCLFDIEGSLEARLAAYFWLGLDLGFMGEVTVVDWEQQLFAITILEFELDCTPNPPVFAQFEGGTGGSDTWNNLSATFVEDGSGVTEYMVMEPPGESGTLYLNMGDRAGDRLNGDTADGDESMFLQQITIEGVEYIQVIYNGLPYMAVDPNNNERLVKVLFLVEDVTQIIANGGNGEDEILIDVSISSDITMTLRGGAGNDEIIALGGGDATLYGDDHDDLLIGGEAVHTIYGGDGADLIEGGLGDDFLYGGDGNDGLVGGEGNDTISGGDHDDRIFGGIGDDIITGDGGNDRIRGEEGEDSIDGGDGDDTIYWVHGDGNDGPVVGGAGEDNLNVIASDVVDDISLFATAGGAVDLVIDSDDTDMAITFDYIEGVTLDAGNGADTIEIGDLHTTDITGVIVDAGQFNGAESHTIGIVETDVQAEDNDGNLLFDGEGVPIMESMSIDFGIAGSASTLAAINAAEEEYGEVSGLTDQTIEASGLDGDEDTIILHGSDGAVSDTVTITRDQNEVQGVVFDVNLAAGASNYDVRIVHGERFEDTQDALIIDTGDGGDIMDASAISDFIDDVTGLSTGSADVIALDMRGGDGNDIIVGSDYDDIIRGGEDDDTLTGGVGVDSFFDAGGNDTLIEQFDADMTLFNNGFVVGELGELVYGDTNFIGYDEVGVVFEKFYNTTLSGPVDEYAPGAEVETFENGIFENAEITGGTGNNTLVIGDDDGSIFVGGVEVNGFVDWGGYVILDNYSNLDPELALDPEYYVIRNSGDLMGTIEILDTGDIGTDELVIDLQQPLDTTTPSNNNQTVIMSSDAPGIDPSDGVLPTSTDGITGSVFVGQSDAPGIGAEILYSDQIEKITIQTGVGDDYVVVEDALVRTAVELGDGDDTISVGVVNKAPDGDGINVVTTYTPGNRDMMVVYGGDGSDVFDVHYNLASLHLYGENDNDYFTVFSYLVDVSDENENDLSIVSGEGDDSLNNQNEVDEDNYDYLYSGEIKIDGGAGIDSFALVGTDIGDEVIITEHFVAGMGHYIELANIETIVIRTVGGNDTISIYSLPADVRLEIDTGSGSDVINFGGNHEPIQLAPPVYNQPDTYGVDVGWNVGQWQASYEGNYSVNGSWYWGWWWNHYNANYSFNQTVNGPYSLEPVPDRVTQSPPEYWLWLGQDYDMSDILGEVFIDGGGGDDIVNMFNGDNQVTDGRITSYQEEEGDPWGLQVSGLSGDNINVSDATELNLYLGDQDDTVTLDIRDGDPLVEEITVFTGAGDDTVYVDAILGVTNVYTGADNDTVHVGDTVADAIGDTLTIDTDRDYSIITSDVTAPDGSDVTVQVMQLTESGIKETRDVQLTDQPGWFVDIETGSLFYVPTESGDFDQQEDGTWTYDVPFDAVSGVSEGDVNPYYYELDGTHTTALTSLWIPSESPTGYHPDLRTGYMTDAGQFFENLESMTLWYMEQELNEVNGDGEVSWYEYVNSTYVWDADAKLYYTITHEGTNYYYNWSYFLSQMGKSGSYSSVQYYKAIGTGNSDGLYFHGEMDNQPLVVEQAVTTATTVTYDTIDNNVQVAGNDQVIVHDEDDTTGDTGTLTETALYGLDMAGHVEYTGVDTFTVELGSGNDQFDVIGTNETTVTFINGNEGDDIITVSGPADGSVADGHTAPDTAAEHDGSLDAVQGELVIDAGAGMNTLIVDDGGDPDGDPDVVITESMITGLAPADISYDATGGSFEAVAGTLDGDAPEFRIRIYGGTGGNSITVESSRNQDEEYTIVNAGLGSDMVTVTETDVTHLIINAESGDDIVDASASNGDSYGLHIHGQLGDDILLGGLSDDIITGDEANDWISGNLGDDLIFGDTAVKNWSGLILVNTTEQEQESDGSDYIEGNQGNDTIFGSGGRDDIIGGSTVAGTADGDDQIDGGSDRDLIAGDNAVITDTALSGQTSVDARFRSLTDNLIYGDDGLPILTSTTFDDPLGANDRYIELLDGAGNDIIAGGADDDWIFGQEGNDHIEGDSALYAKTVADGVSEDDRAGAGSDGDDYIEGGAGDDMIFGNLGQDDIIGGSSTLFGADSTAERADGADTIFGGSGTHSARYDDGATTGDVHARDADVIIGDNGTIHQIVDDVTGLPLTFAHDLSTGEMINARSISIDGYVGGGSLTDIGGDDVIHGEGGDDIIYGQTGDDILYGDGQNDDIVGGMGSDRIFGGNGIDGIIGDDGQILTQLAGTAEELYGLEAGETNQHFSFKGDREGVDGNEDGELIKTARLYSTGDGDDDIIYGGLGGDFIHGGGGNDAISGAEALEEFYDADAAALLDGPVYDPATGTLDFYDPDDPMAKVDGMITNFDATYDDGDDRIFGDDGHDWIVGGTGDDWLFGGSGDDVLNVVDDLDSPGDETGDLGGRDIAYGGSGVDVLIANSHNDQLIDWLGEFNSFIVPFKQFGPATVIRMPSPSVIAYVAALGAEAGADSRYAEPMGEIGLFTQQDGGMLQDNVGAPRDPQPGNGGGKAKK